VNEDESTVLRDRLIGAAALCLLVFVLSLFIPEPAPNRDSSGALVIDLKEGGTSAPRAQESGPEEDGAPAVARSQPSPAASAPRAAKEPRKAVTPAPESVPQTKQPAPERSPPDTATASSAPAQRAPPARSEDATRDKQRQLAAQGDWWIQAASYSDREMAARGRARAAELGYGTALREVRVEGRQWWRLQVGPFTSEAAAQSTINQVEAAGFRGARALERH